MSARPSWGHEVEAFRRRQARRRAARAVLGAVGTVLGAVALLVIGWLFCVGFMVTFG